MDPIKLYIYSWTKFLLIMLL